MEIPKGWRGGVQTKNPPWEGYGYFLEPHNLLQIGKVAPDLELGRGMCFGFYQDKSADK